MIPDLMALVRDASDQLRVSPNEGPRQEERHPKIGLAQDVQDLRGARPL
jgi:chemotaxis regulatin CheY-phosphate phosphatase CheZ